MCLRATGRLLFGVALFTSTAAAQARGEIGHELIWRHLGTSAVDRGLPGVATGPTSRVWFGADNSTFVLTASGQIFHTADSENWVRDTGLSAPTRPSNAVAPSSPLGSRIVLDVGSGRYYAAGSNVFRSDDGGSSWTDVTSYHGQSLLGGPVADLAVSPLNPDEIVVAAATGVWRSVDGGRSWTGLNASLPNLPIGHLLTTPANGAGMLATLRGEPQTVVEWTSADRTAWKPVVPEAATREDQLRARASQSLKEVVTTASAAGAMLYAGDEQGRLFASGDQGVTWARFALSGLGPVESIWVSPQDSRIAIAVLGQRTDALTAPGKPAYVFRTMNGGQFWDDATANLPDRAAAHGVAADESSETIFVATEAGVFMTNTDLRAAGRATSWISIGQALPPAAALDVRLDANRNQLYVALDGYGVYGTLAPKGADTLRIVNAADYSSRPAAPGSLVSVLGARVESALNGGRIVPILAATDSASQLQVPFEASGNAVSIDLTVESRRVSVDLPLQTVSPAIFVETDGSPLLVDGESGTILDSAKSARAGSRVQVLMTGLGRVVPQWQNGVIAPLNNPPRVVAMVRAMLDGAPVEVIQATLAPGYIGFYLVEVRIPTVVNAGPAELYVEAEGQQSNRVRLTLEP